MANRLTVSIDGGTWEYSFDSTGQSENSLVWKPITLGSDTAHATANARSALAAFFMRSAIPGCETCLCHAQARVRR